MYILCTTLPARQQTLTYMVKITFLWLDGCDVCTWETPAVKALSHAGPFCYRELEKWPASGLLATHNWEPRGEQSLTFPPLCDGWIVASWLGGTAAHETTLSTYELVIPLDLNTMPEVTTKYSQSPLTFCLRSYDRPTVGQPLVPLLSRLKLGDWFSRSSMV